MAYVKTIRRARKGVASKALSGVTLGISTPVLLIGAGVAAYFFLLPKVGIGFGPSSK